MFKKHYLKLIFVFLLIFSVFFIPTYTHANIIKNYVNDYANVIDDNVELVLNTKLKNYEATTTTQIVIITQKSLENNDTIETYTERVFRENKIGNKDYNNGILIVLLTDERKIRTETGYGVEGVLPDILTKKIVNDFAIDYFKDENYTQGIENIVNEYIAVLDKNEIFKATNENLFDKLNIPNELIFFLFFIFIQIFFSIVLHMSKSKSVIFGIIFGMIISYIVYYITNSLLSFLIIIFGYLIDSFFSSENKIAKFILSWIKNNKNKNNDDTNIPFIGGFGGGSMSGFTGGGGSSGGGGSNSDW